MINIIPQSEVRLLKTPLEKDKEHTLSFDNINSQTAYFISKVIKSYSDFTYVKEQQAIVVPDNYDTIYTCNYLMYRNNGFNNKYFYAFITKMEYVSENSTRIYFEIDSLQTWYFQIDYKNVFVEREHVSNDTIGLHTIPEGLETGDYIDQSVTNTERDSFNFYQSNSRPLVVCSVTGTGISAIDSGLGRVYNGIYSGLIQVAFPSGTDAEVFMLYLDSKFSESPVVSVYLAPWQMCTDNLSNHQTYTEGSYTFDYYVIPTGYDTTYLKSSSLSKPTILDNNYIPVNKKLLTYPYCYMLVDNNVGQCYEYKYELFSDNECNFQIDGTLSVGCSIKLRPLNYNKKTGLNNNFSVDAGKLPTCSWINDAYTNYLTANAVNIPGVGDVSFPVLSGVAGIGLNALSQNAGGMASSTISVLGSIGEMYSRSKTPLQAHNGSNQGDFFFTTQTSFNVYKRSIKEEYARIIDKYFTMYGYKVNEVKVPNLTSRRNFNYIKTISCDFEGDMPQEDLQKIKDIFNNGVTFWHNPENFLNYSANNDII